jgi:hypothetical protein
VNNTVKVAARKRKNQILHLSFNMTNASIVRIQALWYSAFIALYVWFLYWVAHDFFVLHKSILEANIVNYFGSIISIAFIWVGTKILRRNRNMPRKKIQEPTQRTPIQDSTCTHYLGYLHQRQKSQEIPSECLICEKVIQCFSYTN